MRISISKSAIKFVFVSFVFSCISIFPISGQEIFTIASPNPRIEIQYLNIFGNSQSIIWVGTNQGCYFFNGQTFVSPIWSSKISDEEVSAIGEDDRGQMIFGTKSGRIFLEKSGRVDELLFEEGNPAVPITGINSFQKQLWISTYGEGLYVHDGHHLYNINMDDGLLSDDIYCMTKSGNEVWIGTDAGINIVSFDDGVKNIHSITKPIGLLDEIVLSIEIDQKENAYVGYFNRGISVINTLTHEILNVDEFPQGVDLAMVKDVKFAGHIKYINSESGIFRVAKGTNGILLSEEKFEKINGRSGDIELDDEENLWVLNKEEGIVKISTKMEYQAYSVGSIQAIEKRGDAKILGSNLGLFDVHSSNDRVDLFSLFKEPKNVISLYVDDWQNIWVGTFGDGLYCFDAQNKQLLNLTSEDGLAENSILDIKRTGDHLTLATLGGISKIFYQKIISKSSIRIENTGYPEGLGTNYVYAVANRDYESLWVGMDGQGINYLEDGNIHSIQSSELELPLSAFNIAPITPSSALVGSSDQGLLSINNGILSAHKSWLPGFESEIFGLTHDTDWNTYVATNDGIYFHSSQSDNFAKYNYEIARSEFEPNLNSFFMDSAGALWVGGLNGLIKFQMNSIPARTIPNSKILNIQLFDQPIDTSIKKTFKYNENYLVFNFVGLWYSCPEKVVYQYRLDGLDKDWTLTNEPSIAYHHLPVGRYNFQVRSSITGDFEIAPVSNFSFSVRPPFWRHPMFLIISFLSIAFLIRYLMKQRELRIAERESIDREKIESQYQALKSQINPHFLFNSFNTLIGTIEENPKSAVNYVEKLSDFYRSILKFREKNLIPLLEELTLVENYVSLLRERFGEGIELDVELVHEDILIAPLSLQMLVENAVKHNVVSVDQPLTIKIRLRDNQYIWIHNNLQKKTQIEPTTRYGLANLKNRYQLLTNSKVEINETKDYFEVLIPILKKKL